MQGLGKESLGSQPRYIGIGDGGSIAKAVAEAAHHGLEVAFGDLSVLFLAGVAGVVGQAQTAQTDFDQISLVFRRQARPTV